MNNEGNCDTCAWWQPLGDGLGQCRRYAPRPRTSIDSVMWPTTDETDWCAEYDDADCCGCSDDETCPICLEDALDEISEQFDEIVAELTKPTKQRRWRRGKAA
jgi:hypothetical protein